jgi:tetratricopeptide (TPR) repeat protein
LTDVAARADYDRYLAAQARTRVLDVSATPALVPPPPEEPPVPVSATPAPSTQDPTARKRALARRLRSGVMERRPSGEIERPPISDESRELLEAEMKRRLGQARTPLQQPRIEHYLEAAAHSARDNNPIAVVNALRIAHGIDPAYPGLTERLRAAEQAANAALAESYLEQAQYEERTGNLRRAAQSYEKAAKGRNSARLFERAAHCELEADGDLKHARQNARAAVSLAPAMGDYHVTLGRVLLRAGMRQGAIGEFERAVEIEPDNPTVKDWLKRVKRGEV